MEQAKQLLTDGRFDAALQAYQQILNASLANGATGDEKDREQAILGIGKCLAALKRPQDMSTLIRGTKTSLTALSKAKTTKIIRQLIDLFAEIPQSLAMQVEVVKDLVDWAQQDKRVYLKQNLEARLIALYLDNKMYTDALALIATLLKELKRLDDKMMLVEVQLLESRAYWALKNYPKSRAALTSARTSANAIYCPPLMQAALDMQSGILHADDKDYKTAYSYFYEALEGYSSQEDSRSVLALKYMLLCKIMMHTAEDVHGIIAGKLALKYRGPELEAMKAVADAHQERSIQSFEKALASYTKELQNDPIIHNHLQSLYDTMLEQNLLRIVEPFSRVELTHIAELIKLQPKQVEIKLSQMILDKVLSGILDQSNGTLVIYDEPERDKTFDSAIDTIKSMGLVVESLYQKAQKL